MASSSSRKTSPSTVQPRAATGAFSRVGPMLYPEARAAVEAAALDTPVWTEGYDVEAARVANRELALQEEPEDVAEVVDLDAGGVRVRLYRPSGSDGGLV